MLFVRAVAVKALAQEALRRITQIEHLTFQLGGEHCHWSKTRKT